MVEDGGWGLGVGGEGRGYQRAQTQFAFSLPCHEIFRERFGEIRIVHDSTCFTN